VFFSSYQKQPNNGSLVGRVGLLKWLTHSSNKKTNIKIVIIIKIIYLIVQPEKKIEKGENTEVGNQTPQYFLLTRNIFNIIT
jgi:hypothetical protein